jgi:hypothetical protein
MPTFATGSVGVVIESGVTTLIVMGQAKVFGGTFESETVTVNDETPGVVGVPVTAPVELLSVKPAGKVPLETVHVRGATPPFTTTDDLYESPTMPVGIATFEIVGSALVVSVMVAV